MFYNLFLLLMEISELEFVIAFGVFIILLLAIFIAMFLVTSYKRKIKNKQLLARLDFEKNQAILQTQIEIQEQTLKTISQEIHDNIGQVLSLAKLNLGTLQYGEDEKLNDTKNLVSKAINDLRDLSRSLHGDKIAELGLQSAVENELKILQNTGQYHTTLQITGEPYKLEAQKEMVLFRIVQEAIHNAVKHAKAKNITVQLNYWPNAFVLIITDDGIGFDTADLQAVQTGIGLKSMQNRAALIGGQFTITAATGSGTKIKIELKK
jgi:two-component system, NarL family, sensor kinase